MSVNTELQALLTKMGGTPSEEDSNSDLIKKISNAYESGGSSGGEGNCILAVRLAEGEPAVPPYEAEGTTPVQTLVADKSWNDIKNAMVAGKLVILILPSANDSVETGIVAEALIMKNGMYTLYLYKSSTLSDIAFIATDPSTNMIGYYEGSM